MFVYRKQSLFLSVCVDDIKMSGKKQNLAPMWKKLMKNVDGDELTSFLDHVYLGCRNHVLLLEQQRNYRDGRNLKHKQWRGLGTLKDMLKSALSDTVNCQTRKWSNFTSFSSLVWTIQERRIRSHFGSRPFLARACVWFFLRHELFWFCLVYNPVLLVPTCSHV